MEGFGKILVFLGLILLVFGLVFMFSDKLPFLGKLPGDVLIKRDNFTFYAPIATSVIISIILTILLSIVFNLRK